MCACPDEVPPGLAFVGLRRFTPATGLTGPNRVRVQLEFFIDLDMVIGFLAGQVHPPYKYKGPQPIEASNRSKYKTNLLFHCLYFYLSTLAFPTPLSIVLPSSPRRLKAF